MVHRSLTVVLPVYNAESCLGSCVREILELASELTRDFAVLVIDDGSTDATSEIAAELARRFPQVSSHRHRHRRGLGAALEKARCIVTSNVAIVHDGTSPIDPEEIRKLWRDCVAAPARRLDGPIVRTTSRPADMAEVPAAHRALAQAHARILGFQLWTLQHDAEPLPAEARAGANQRRDVAHGHCRAGVGQIPPLPRPKFLRALAEFALGE